MYWISHCLLCQDNNAEPVRVGSSAGKNRISEVVEIRRKLEDTDSTLLRDRLSCIAETEWESNSIHWHKSCYGSFTSKDHLK